MTFTQNNASFDKNNVLSKVKKDISTIQSEVAELSEEISSIDNDLQDYKQTVANEQSGQNTQINANLQSLNNLQEYTENYVEQNKELIETQVLRASEYVETPLIRAVSAEITNYDNSLESITEEQSTQNTNIEQNTTDIENLKNRTSILKQKVDTILEQGEIPVTTDEVQLGDAYITKHGNTLYGYQELPIADEYKPVAGNIYSDDTSSHSKTICLKSNGAGYMLGVISTSSSDEPIEDIFAEIGGIVSPYYKQVTIPLYEGTAIDGDDENKILNSGLISDILTFEEDKLSEYTFNDELDYIYILTKNHKVYKYENRTLTDVTETTTVIPANAPYIFVGYYCRYWNYGMARQFNSRLTHVLSEDYSKWTYWELMSN